MSPFEFCPHAFGFNACTDLSRTSLSAKSAHRVSDCGLTYPDESRAGAARRAGTTVLAAEREEGACGDLVSSSSV